MIYAFFALLEPPPPKKKTPKKRFKIRIRDSPIVLEILIKILIKT